MARDIALFPGRTRSRTRRWLIRYPRALPLGIFLLVSCVTLFSVIAIENGEAARRAVQMETRASAIAFALERRGNASSAYLRAGGALLSMMDEVPVAEFARFVSQLRLADDYRGVEGIGWAPVLRHDDLPEFEARLAREHPGFRGIYPRPDPQQPYIVPVTFILPDTPDNRAVVGFDMYSEPNRRAAMLEAERDTKPHASDAVVLRQAGRGTAPGFVIFMPVFAPAPGGQRLKGFVYSPFDAPAFLASTLELEDAGEFAVQLFDGDAEDLGVALASTLPEGTRPVASASKTVRIANNSWLVVVGRIERSGLAGLSMATLIFGLLVAALLTIVVRMLTQQAMEDEVRLGWFEEQASIRNSLTRELNHRVKNTLANVLSIIALTRRRTTNLDDFAEGLDGRIRALSATHDLLTKSDWGTTPVSAVIEAELLPYANDGDHVVSIEGPHVELAPNDALSLGLAVHELATNAAKYGALSQAGGTVRVAWEQVEDSFVRIEWREQGGPPVPAKRGRGFGTDLIERIVAHELRHPVELEFPPEGVRCVLLVPVRQPRAFALRAGSPPAGRG